MIKITLDFETYYSKEFNLAKMTTEEYIRHNDFEVIGVGIKVGGGETVWASGDHVELLSFLIQYDWDNAALIGQNTMFDGAILNWIFGIRPKMYADTMCMSRAIDGVHVSASLKAQGERHLPKLRKGDEVLNAMGMRRKDFGERALSKYGDYCINDVDMTYELFKKYIQDGFPPSELRVIDLTLRMFIEPILELDAVRLEGHLYDVVRRKEKLIEEAGVTKDDLMSNNRFAELLKIQGIEPPTKISPKTGKTAYAFAKTDEGFKALLEHDNDNVQALANARIGNKSTLEETRTERFIGIAKRGNLPVPIKYYGAHTGRFSGQDKINLQNLPSRGLNGKKIKNTIMAPEGHVIIEGDLSQIEARLVAWLAGQQDLVDAFARGDDVYVVMASKIYNIPESEVTDAQRFIGKMTILGAGYGMGPDKFSGQIKAVANVDVPLDESKMIIHKYRTTNFKVKKLWYAANDTIACMARGDNLPFGRKGVLGVDASKNAILLPNGLAIYYPELQITEKTSMGPQFGYKSRKGIEKIYGGLLTENVCQALAKIIISDQMVLMRKRYPVALTVHDSVAVVVPIKQVWEGAYFVYKCLRHVPTWAEGLPLDCEVGFHQYYGSTSLNDKDVTEYCLNRWEEERMDIIGQNGNNGEHYT